MLGTSQVALTIDPKSTVLGYKLAAQIEVLRSLDIDTEQMASALSLSIAKNLLSKDERPKLTEEEKAAKADDAEDRARIYSAVHNHLDSNPPPAFVEGDRTTMKTVSELINDMNVPRLDRTPRLTHALRSVLASGKTDWGIVAVIDKITFYGARPRLLQYQRAA